MSLLTKLKLETGHAPHLHSGRSSVKTIGGVLAALTPAFLAGLFFFGLSCLFIFLASYTVFLALTSLMNRTNRQNNSPAEWLYGALVSMLFALLAPQGAHFGLLLFSFLMALLIGFFAFGGFGKNIFHLSMLALAFFFFFTGGPDNSFISSIEKNWVFALLWAGGLFCVFQKWVRFETPLFYGASLFSVSLLMGENPMSLLWSAPLLLCAFYVLPDTVASPLTQPARIGYGFLAGSLTLAGLHYLNTLHAQIYGVLLANAFIPILDRIFQRRKET